MSNQEVRECDQNGPFNCAKDFWLDDVPCQTFLTGRGGCVFFGHWIFISETDIEKQIVL